MVNRLSRFKLKSENDEGIRLDQVDVKDAKEECERSLMGKVWGEKEANFSKIRNTFSLLWCNKGNLKVVELGQNFFQFIFSNKEDLNRAIENDHGCLIIS